MHLVLKRRRSVCWESLVEEEEEEVWVSDGWFFGVRC